jgi:hypothetical protein
MQNFLTFQLCRGNKQKTFTDAFFSFCIHRNGFRNGGLLNRDRDGSQWRETGNRSDSASGSSGSDTTPPYGSGCGK